MFIDWIHLSREHLDKKKPSIYLQWSEPLRKYNKATIIDIKKLLVLAVSLLLLVFSFCISS